ncbi:MAG: hypothetical protein IT211_12020 [Armatimonadetes bacterium]|nr:hypothetical protein [Armatimonadota bacterium]
MMKAKNRATNLARSHRKWIAAGGIQKKAEKPATVLTQELKKKLANSKPSACPAGNWYVGLIN